MKIAIYVCYINPESKLEVVFPKNGFIQKDSREVGGPDQSNYFYFENQNRNKFFSGWFAEENEYPGIKKYYEELVTSYKNASFLIPKNVSFKKIGG